MHDADRTKNEPTETDQPIMQHKKKLRQHSVCLSTKKPSQSPKCWSWCSWNLRR